MADHSGGARDESNVSEASQALMLCFGNASPEKSCFVVDFGPFVLPSLRVFVFLNAAATEWNIPQQTNCSFFSFLVRLGGKEFTIAEGIVKVQI